MLQKATSIIDNESNIASTDERKSLLIGFADLRGSMAMAIGAIRAYLLTADLAFKKEFEELWALNQKKFEALAKRRAEMTSAQQSAFDALVDARAKFSPLPQKMFEIRASDRWNMAQWFLTNEAAPAPTSCSTSSRAQRTPPAHVRAAWLEATGQSETGWRCRHSPRPAS